MVDTEKFPPFRESAVRPVQASASAGTGPRQAPQSRNSAATQYWQGVATAGRAAGSAEGKGERQAASQRPSARTKP